MFLAAHYNKESQKYDVLIVDTELKISVDPHLTLVKQYNGDSKGSYQEGESVVDNSPKIMEKEDLDALMSY